MKKKSKIILGSSFLVLNLILLFSSVELKALPQAELGVWGCISGSGESGEIVDYECYSGGEECIVGETGRGFYP